MYESWTVHPVDLFETITSSIETRICVGVSPLPVSSSFQTVAFSHAFAY
ncbi:hypothetical protein ACFQL4_04205 [Halosimplex aquaticum]